MNIIRARNKIVEGKYKEHYFRIKRGQLFLCCLEKEITIKRSMVCFVKECNYFERPKMMNMLARGYLGKVFWGTLGMIVGISTADRRGIHILLIRFSDDKEAIAEVDDDIYNKLMIL